MYKALIILLLICSCNCFEPVNCVVIDHREGKTKQGYTTHETLLNCQGEPYWACCNNRVWKKPIGDTVNIIK